MTSPTQRTLALLKRRGFTCGIVERFVGKGAFGKRIDLFGIIDIIALGPNGVLGVQSCGTAFSDHYKKMTIENRDRSIKWLTTPGTSLALIGWRKVKKKRGGKQMIYKPRVHVFHLDDFPPVAIDCKKIDPQ